MEPIPVSPVPGLSDSEAIQAAVDLAAKSGGTVVIPKRDAPYSIDRTIALPGGVTVIVDGAHLRQADGVFCQMFATKNYLDGTKDELHDIKLLGKNGALLDGGTYNRLSERNSKKDGRPSITVNTMLMMYNVSGLEVGDLRIINQRWWAVTNLFADHAYYHDIDFKADLSRVDENGVHHPDELPKSYEEIYVKNADGIDLRLGCHDFVIENITGFTEDDSVALTALSGFEVPYRPDGKATDICHVEIRHIRTDCYTCAHIRLLCEEGNQIHHVRIEDVEDARTDPRWRALSTVRIGDTPYGRASQEMGDIRDITIDGVKSHAKFGVSLCKTLKDSTISHITVDPGYTGFGVLRKAQMENVTIEY